ncbi:MAG: helix-turn-helix transcriptional regulator, partial [Thermoplasmata archaeon]
PQETSAAPPPPPWTPPVGVQVEERFQEASKEDMYRLAIRLLTGDERKMFRRIVDAGGKVLQKDLVAEGSFSKAKVTRLLDKLESKRLIVRERYGATNRVRISEDLGL